MAEKNKHRVTIRHELYLKLIDYAMKEYGVSKPSLALEKILNEYFELKEEVVRLRKRVRELEQELSRVKPLLERIKRRQQSGGNVPF